MPKRIDSITEEQKVQLQAYAQDWIKKALDPTPADRARVEDGIRRCYAFAGLAAPEVIEWVANPLEVAKRGPIHAVEVETGKPVPEDQRASIIRENWRKYLGGALWGSWAAYAGACRDVLDLELEGDAWQRYDAWCDAQSAGWWWPHEKFVIICDRPTRIMLERVGADGWGSHRLHALDGPAVAWPGLELYYIHGVRVPEHTVMRPETITIAEIEGYTNAEVRRTVIDQYGRDRYMRDCGADVIDDTVDEVGNPIRLLRKNLEGDEPIVTVELTNSTVDPDGSVRKYLVRVPPTMTSALAARNWVCKLDPDVRYDVQT